MNDVKLVVVTKENDELLVDERVFDGGRADDDASDAAIKCIENEYVVALVFTDASTTHAEVMRALQLASPGRTGRPKNGETSEAEDAVRAFFGTSKDAVMLSSITAYLAEKGIELVNPTDTLMRMADIKKVARGIYRRVSR